MILQPKHRRTGCSKLVRRVLAQPSSKGDEPSRRRSGAGLRARPVRRARCGERRLAGYARCASASCLRFLVLLSFFLQSCGGFLWTGGIDFSRRALSLCTAEALKHLSTRMVPFRWAITSAGKIAADFAHAVRQLCLLYTSPSPRDQRGSRMPSSA